MALIDLFRPRWRHSDAKVRQAAVERLSKSREPSDKRLLLRLAEEDPSESVRRTAVQSVDHQRSLASIAKRDPHESVRLEAVSRLSEFLDLHQIAEGDPVEAVRVAAKARSEKVKADQAEFIRRIAESPPNENFTHNDYRFRDY